MNMSVVPVGFSSNAHDALHDDHPAEKVVDVVAVDLQALAVVT